MYLIYGFVFVAVCFLVYVSYKMINLYKTSAFSLTTLISSFTPLEDISEAFSESEDMTSFKRRIIKQRSNFLNNLGADMRILLTSLMGNVETNFVNKEEKGFSSISSNLLSMIEVVDDMFDISLYDIGGVSVSPCEFNLKERISIYLKEAFEKLSRKGIVWSSYIDPEIHGIKSDKLLVEKIVMSLLSGVITLSESGSVSFRVDRVEDKKVKFTATFLLSGATEDIFLPFYKVSSDEGYLSVGLSLHKLTKMVELLKGSVELVSEEDNTTIEVYLPVEYIELEEAPIKELNYNLMKPIAIVEDIDTNRELVEAYLKHMGITKDKFCAYKNGREVIDAYGADKFSLILMDLSMPEMDGITAAGIIRDREKTNNSYTPIIALTAYVLEEDRRQCLEVGMDAFVTKPVLLPKLRDAIEEVLKDGARKRKDMGYSCFQ